MQCLHCGKKLSLLRKLSDGRFCSEAHREEYERLQNDLALARLMGARGSRHAQRDKSGGRTGAGAPIPPMAPVLPETLRVACWGRLASPPLQLLAFQIDRWIPESALRPAVRGFPKAPPAEISRPAVWSGAAPAAVEALPAFPCPYSGDSLPGARIEAQAAGGAEAPAVAGLIQLPLDAIGSCRAPSAAIPLPSLVARRKLVVIVPKPARRFRAAMPAGAELRPVELRPAGTAPGRADGRLCWLAPAEDSRRAIPSLLRKERADGALRAAVREARGEASAGEAPFCGKLEPPGAVAPAGAAPPLPAAAPELLVAALPGRFPATCLPPLCPQLPQPRLQPVQTEPYSVAQATTAQQAQAWWDIPEPQALLPRAGLVLRGLNREWPAIAGLVRVDAPPAGAAAKPIPVTIAPLETRPDILRPALKAAAPARILRLVWRQAGVELQAACSAGPSFRHALPEVEWSGRGPAAPASGLELIPPDSSAPAPAMWEGEAAAGRVSLAALEAAVAGPAWTREEDRPGEVLPAPEALAKGSASEPQAPAPSPEEAPAAEAAPPMARRVPEMPVRPVDRILDDPAPATPVTATPCWASLEQPRPMIPHLRLELDHADGSGPRRREGTAPRKRAGRKTGGAPTGRRFWSHAPSDLKWIAVVLPLLLVVVVYSFRAKAPNHPPEGSDMTATATAPAAPAEQNGRLNALQRIILRRAAVRLFDDFRGGLGSWEGREGWAKTWRYGDATFVEPGELALLTPSLSMSDYTLTFLGQIERRSLNWVFRARDLSNYYSMRIVITRGGPLPEAAVVRSVVINGKEQNVKTLPIPFPVRADTLYLVRMEVRGQDFTTYIQNQVVDHFSDARLKRGGIGFYSPKGDRALLRWVEVSHQYDYLGRLCALLSPYGVQNLAGN